MKKELSPQTDDHLVKKDEMIPTMSEILLYNAPGGKVRVEMLIQNETIWLSQQRIAELFDVGIPAINKHLKNIFESGELDENSVISILEITAADGKRYKTKHYNLDAIISVGYRVSSSQATHFRIWATQVLKEYIIKGFAMDDERLKNPVQPFGKDYFDEQLARIRDIRSSERRFYQKITDIYAQCSADYDPNSQITQEFYATVQNKFHFAITGMTAAEIVRSRADSTRPNMGLMTWKNAPDGNIRKEDVSIAKNYLTLEELDTYNRIVEMYLNFAELQANSRKIMYQKDWIEKLHAFLTLNDQSILHDKGKVTAVAAKALAESEFEKFRVIRERDYISDFDKIVAKIPKGGTK